ncbi:hypothetical protein [Hydrogenophaga sp. BPS33]|uniref:hypothetical protein n=1 Tax=Hydrogenophaga sp. BPS33 TaxID=2651974 RepID=UPI0013201F33|nr:hypothetical protein [Hydrogenophaga sp. BPS33]QHE85150.1 hypothetical protein F9K07_09760 [Hydrogenophaga sp. BPS33]
MNSTHFPKSGGPPQRMPNPAQTAPDTGWPTPLANVGHVRPDVADQLPPWVQYRQAAFRTQTPFQVVLSVPIVSSSPTTTTTAQKRTREPEGAEENVKRYKAGEVQVPQGLPSRTDTTPSGFGAQILPSVGQVAFVTDMLEEAQRAAVFIALTNTTPTEAVSSAGKALEKLFSANQLEAAGTVLKALGFKLRVLEMDTGHGSQKKRSAVMRAMWDFGAPISSSMMGACHAYRSKDSFVTPWYASLRFQIGRTGLSYEGIVTHYASSVVIPEQRMGALCATVGHLSWIAPPWNGSGVEAQRSHEAMRRALVKLFDIWEKVYDSSDKHVFLQQILSAIVPAYCSPRMADALGDFEGVPAWLKLPLRARAQAVLDDKGPRLFEMGWLDKRVRHVVEQTPIQAPEISGAPLPNFVAPMSAGHPILSPASLPPTLGSVAPHHLPPHLPHQQPSFQRTLPGWPSDSGQLNNTAVRSAATQAMAACDTGTAAGLRDFMSRMAWLVGLPSTRDLTLEPSQRVEGLFIKLQETAIVCASGASHEWGSEQAFWNTVIDELRSPAMDALGQVMAQRAGEELDGRRLSTGATIAMFHQLLVAPSSGSRDPDDWVESVWGEFGSNPYQGEDLEPLASSQWLHDDMFASGSGLSEPAPNNATVQRLEFQIPARGTAQVQQSAALPQTPDWGALWLPQTPVQSATPQALQGEEPDAW